jgi:hypothetical protein
MKTAISIPDDTFERASRRAHELGMSRSEFFTRAAVHYLDDLDAHSVTREIDLAIDSLQGADESTALAVRAGRHLVDDLSGDW